MARARGLASSAVCLLAAAGHPEPGLAQATEMRGSPLKAELPGWATNWSPLARVADLARELPSGPAFPDLLSFPAPRVGLFWTVGNPASLPLELEDARVEFRAGARGASGDYARPLDPGDPSSGAISTMGWRPLGDRGAVIGSAVFDRTTFGDSLFADVQLPHSSNPFVVMDTIGDPVRRNAFRLEGATGRRFGKLSLGVAVGWEGQSNRTIASPVPRLDRTATPGATGGVVYEIGPRVRIGAHARWRQQREFIQIATISQPSRVFQIEGFEEPIPLDLQPNIFDRRFERNQYALGGSVGLDVLGGTWVVFGQREHAEEDQFTNQREADPPTDRWDADGWTVGGAAQWGAAKERWLITLDARYTTLEGEAFSANVRGIVFTVDEERFIGDLDARLGLGRGWRAGVHVGVRRDTDDRRDLLAQATSNIRSWQGGAALELARVFSRRFAASIGGRFSSYGPSGEIPDPDDLGPVYRRFIGPGLALQLAEAFNAAGTATLRFQAAERTGFWVRGQFAVLDPTGSSIPLLPTGTRRGWTFTAGAILEEIWP